MKSPSTPTKPVVCVEEIYPLIPRDGTVHRASDIAKAMRTSVAKVMDAIKDTEVKALSSYNKLYLYRL